MAVKIIIRHDSAANWASFNPTLALGELGFDTDSKKYKLGDGSTAWNSLSYAGMTTTEINSAISTAVSNLIDAAPGALDTLNELAAAINDDASFFTTIETRIAGVEEAIDVHNSDLTDVHGISDTRNLVYETQLISAMNAHASDTTDIHGIADTANLAVKNNAEFTGTLSLPAETTIETVGGVLQVGPNQFTTLSEITATAAELNTLDGITASTAELNTLDGITASTAELNTLDGITATVSELNTLDGIIATTTELNQLSGLTAGSSELNILDGATLSTAELNLLDGVTATTAELNILDGVTATAVEINTLDGITASTAELNILDGATLTTTELNYVDGVTSSIQTQLNSKAPTANPTFTGTVSGLTKDMVGLNNVDNTADADKPVSTAQQTALDGKADITGDTFTGAVAISDTTPSTSHTSGALTVAGGVGIEGDLNAAGVSYFGEPTSLALTNPVAFFTKDVDDYIQLGIQNTNNGTSASSDIVLTADNGTNTTHYLDIGIASSGYDYPDFGFIQPNDGYLIVEGGALGIAASTGGKSIDFYVGGTLETDEVGSWSETALTVENDLTVNGTITGNLTGDVTGNLTGDVTGDVTGNVSGNAGTVTNGVYTTDTGTVTNTMLAGSIADSKLSTISSSNKVANSATTATDANTANAIVARDSSGNFSANQITLASNPTDNSHAATKSYVDNIAAGISFQPAVKVATTENLVGTYSNGASGVGATITITATGGLDIDGHTALLNERVLVKDQTIGYQNGIYYISTAGDTGVSAVLTRDTDYDNSPSGEINYGDFVFVELGDMNAGYGYINNTSGSITVGTTAISFTQFSASQSLLAGNGLTKSGSTVDIVSASSARIAVTADAIDLATVSQSDSSGTAGTSFVQSHTVDAYGRVTGTVTASVQDATSSAKGIASFATGTFSVSSGAVDVATGGITNGMLAGSIADSKLSTISTSGKVSNSATTATELNTANAIVARDSSGNFTAGIITAALSGNADTATNATDSVNSTNVGTTEDTTTNGTKYLTWVDANTGNNPIKTTSTKLTFNPSTGVLGSTVFAGALSVSSAGATFNDGTVQVTAGVPSITTISRKTGSHTLSSLSERDTIIEISSTSGTTLTIPLDSNTNFPIGTTLDIIQTNTGQVTIAGDTGVTVNATPGLKLRTQWSSATLLKRAENTWLVFGDLSA